MHSPRDPVRRDRMHPADLASHRAQRSRAEHRALERDLGRLLPRLDTDERLALLKVRRAALDGAIAIADAHGVVRHLQAQLDQAQAA